MTVRRVLFLLVGAAVAVALLVPAGAWAAGLAAGATAPGGTTVGSPARGGAIPGRAITGSTGRDGAAPAGAVPGVTATGVPQPVGLELPTIGVRSALVPLGLEPDGTVAVPALDSPDAGWFTGSPAPGERGPAVILGHVDSARTGPSVFFRLAELRPGDPVRVTRADGRVVAFRVDRVQRVAKSAFPTAEVYGDLDHPGIRLITCGGVFDRGSYLDNVIVYGSAP